MRILVVEDDKPVADYILKGLKEAGHTVDHASDGRDGLYLAAGENYDADDHSDIARIEKQDAGRNSQRACGRRGAG